MVVASFYAACRSLETPRSLKDIVRVSNISEKEISRSYRILLCEMEIKMPVPDAARSVSKIAAIVGLSERTKRKALEILRMAREDEASAGKDPLGLAGSAIYAASILENEHVSQKSVARAATVTEVTIRNRCKTLLPILQRLRR
jgi:transcription initiation factor TFIIB